MAAGERIGKCFNIGNCSLADKREPVTVKAGQDFACPECGKSLIAGPPEPVGTGGGGGGRTPLLIGGLLVLLALLGLGGWLGGLFGNRSTETTATATTTETTTPAPVVIKTEAEPVLRLGGSNTIGAKLAPALVAAFFREEGCRDVETRSPAPEQIVVACELNGKPLVATVAAQGSSTAFEGLGGSTFDIGMASRKVKDDEVKSLANLGDMTAPSNEHVLALDGIAVIVHPGNRVSSLTQDQVAAIFTGVVTDWKQVGGAPGPIKPYARDDKSGTFDTFKTLVLGSTPLVEGAERFTDGGKLSVEVANDPSAIGFVGLSSVGGAKAVAVGPAGAVALVPNRFTVATEDYALSRRLFLYTAQSSNRPEVARFVRFAISPAGQRIVGDTGFVPLTIRQEAAQAPTGAPSGYEALVGKALRLSTNFRFRTNSADLDNRALADLDRVTEFLASSSVQPDRLMLFGFADSRGEDARNQTLSENRAQSIATALQRRGVAPGTVRGFGEAIPVADNETPEGQEKNRRVEVWVRR